MLSALSSFAASATAGEAKLLGSVSPKGRRISFDDILGWICIAAWGGARRVAGLQSGFKMTSCRATRANAVFLSGPWRIKS